MKLWPWSEIAQLKADLDQALETIDQAEEAITELWIANMHHTAEIAAMLGAREDYAEIIRREETIN